MDIILGASIVAAFFAGMVALFAPCCIGFIFPAYMASVFKKRSKIIRMTLVFFGGIAVVMVPIGLGAAWLAVLFRDFHNELYLVGGVFMVVLGIMAILGKNLTMFPKFKNKSTSGGSMNAKSVFGLGVISGAATSCCAPVLAGAMTLAAISGAFWKALIVIFAYVFGMVFPLFIGASFYDKFKLENLKIVKGKLIEFKLGEKKLTVHTTNLFSALLFVVMGAILIVMAITDNTFWAPESQVIIGQQLSKWSQLLVQKVNFVPDIVWGSAIVGIFLFFVVKAKRFSRKKNE